MLRPVLPPAAERARDGAQRGRRCRSQAPPPAREQGGGVRRLVAGVGRAARRAGAAVWEGEEGRMGVRGVKVEDSNFGGFFCICACHVAPCEGVWTKVAQLNKFRVLDFDFASSWT